MLAEAEAVALRLPSWVNVPAGALNTTGVISNRNELVLRSRGTEPLAAQVATLRETALCIGGQVWAKGTLYYYPTSFEAGLAAHIISLPLMLFTAPALVM